MFKKIIQISSGLALLTTSQLFCSTMLNAEKDNKPFYYPFLSKFEIDNLMKKNRNLHIIDKQQTEHILSVMRNVDTDISTFRQNSDRLIRILIEQALSQIGKQQTQKLSPMGLYDAHELKFKDSDICFVSILRSGNAFLMEALKIITGASIGQILIQRNEETAMPNFYFQKLPQNIKNQQVILVDPMLGTGGSAGMAVKILKNHGVEEENITFLTIISCENGLTKLFNDYPKIKIITAQVDPLLLKDSKYIAPGIGDFGDRYFGTIKTNNE